MAHRGLLAVVLAVNFVVSSAIQDYCSINNFVSNGTDNNGHMKFTKEPSVEEFAIKGKFKALHCCAKGYRSIEWYKDGRPYPWSLTLSQMILYPESANQTVYAKMVTEDDGGNYTCLLRNDHLVHSHTIQLKVFEKIPDDPKITFISPDLEVPVGHSLRLFCEAFAGRVDLPDARNEAVWLKSNHNGSLDNEPRILQEKTSREEEQTFGTYLTIARMRPEDFGEYICKISKPGRTIEQYVYVREKVEVQYLDPNPVPVAKLLLCISALIFLSLMAVMLNLRYGLPLRVRLKDQFGASEENDGKANDILMLYASKDTEIALGVLLPTLQDRYKYKCTSAEFPSVNCWSRELQAQSPTNRRILAVLSPAALEGSWDASSVHRALKHLQEFASKLVCVSLKEMPLGVENEAKNSHGDTLVSLIKELGVIVWERSVDCDNFWLALRLRLPPKRCAAVVNGHRNNLTTAPEGENASRLTSDCSEDNFV